MGSLRIISRRSGPFRDRTEAGILLGEVLKDICGPGAVVLGIPRGGVIVARELAWKIEAELDVVLARKVGAPGNPELAIGAVTEAGKLFLVESSAGGFDEETEYFRQEKSRALAQIAERAGRCRRVRSKLSLTDRTVVVTDDGVATGATMRAALWSAGQEHPAKLIAALPVAPEDTLKALADHTDEVICLRVPTLFGAVSQFYQRFDQIEEEELLKILEEEAERNVEK